MPEICVNCEHKIKAREHFLRCDLCQRSTHRCCGDRLNIDMVQYRALRRGELEVIFHCKNCTESAGQVYDGKVHILKPASANISVELVVSEVQKEDIVKELHPLLTPPSRRIVDYSLSSTDVSIKIICFVPE